ncbi:MAG: hypothetical protein O7H40_05290, partial [Gammaproteobacteria bacterium]|nr:hypothetical protein [Gammaproteobacteria bacterium]
ILAGWHGAYGERLNLRAFSKNARSATVKYRARHRRSKPNRPFQIKRILELQQTVRYRFTPHQVRV